MLFKKVFACLIIFGLAGCASVDVTEYAENKPKLELTQFFNGELGAHGILKNRSGEVIRRFSATIDAKWDENGVGVLDEVFEFDDGEIQTRVWTLTPNGDDQYLATAGDVVGSGQARTSGNALFLDYTLRIPYNDSTLDVKIDDRMYLVSDSILINESIMYKFGFQVGEIVLVIIKLG